MTDIQDDYATGSLKSPIDPSDYIYEHLAHGPPGTYQCKFPDEYDLRPWARPSRNQGSRTTCAAFTASTIKEIHAAKENGFDEWMSPEFVYYHRKNKNTNGMYGRNVFQILQKIGCVPESKYPYFNNETAPAPDDELYKFAAQYKIINYARVTTIEGLKRALLELGPCYLLLPLYETRPQFWRRSNGEFSNVGHALTVVGYNREGIILKNSWGAHWNGDGCVIFPYSDWPVHWECWVCVDKKSEKEIVRGQTRTSKIPNTPVVSKKPEKSRDDSCIILTAESKRCAQKIQKKSDND